MLVNAAPPDLHWPGYGVILDRWPDPKTRRQKRRPRAVSTSSLESDIVPCYETDEEERKSPRPIVVKPVAKTVPELQEILPQAPAK